MYSCSASQACNLIAYGFLSGNFKEEIFSGSVSELKEKDELFWKAIVENGAKVSPALVRATESKKTVYRDYTVKGFASLKGSRRLPFATAKASGLSALMQVNEDCVVIIREKI